jgi:hypothetical protein
MHIYKWQWRIVQSHLRGEVSTSYFTPSTPMDPPQFRKITGSSHSGYMTIIHYTKFKCLQLAIKEKKWAEAISHIPPLIDPPYRPVPIIHI